MSEQEYRELQPGDIIQEGDQWQNECGRWRPFLVLDGSRVQVRQSQRVRRPIGTTHQATYEEVPGSRTTQQAIDQPQRERIAYEELRPGTEVQAGDQYRNTQGRWVEYSIDTSGVPIVGPTAMARRPHNITALEKYRGDLIDDIQHVIGERHEARKERDLARSEVARLSTELWARKPLDERVTSLTDALAQAREGNQQLQDERDELKAALRESHAAHKVTMEQGLAAIAERNEAERLLAEARMERDGARSDQKVIQGCRDTALQELTEARAEVQRLQEVVNNLYNEPTAKQVQEMLRTWATELDWSAGCFDSVGRDEIDTIQKTLIAVIERIETILNPEGGSDDN